MICGAIEAGGSKFICGVGTGPDDLLTTRIPTTSPDETVAAALMWLRSHNPRTIGIASFGPVDLKRGRITSTPKTAWRNYDLKDAVENALGVEAHFDTDVNAAVLAEARWGAARGVDNCLYLTIGTGVGGGAITGGRIVHGLTHPEMGHIRIPHDRERDPFPGVCPYHGDCLEGLASGPAIQARWGAPGESLPSDHPAWPLEALYLALGIAAYICTLSPERILVGGGVMRQTGLFALIRTEVDRTLSGYIARLPEITPPGLGERSGILGALALAQRSA